MLCSLLFNEISEESKKKEKPIIDFRVSGHVPQSKSLKPLSYASDVARKNIAFLGAPFTYLRTCKAA